jgi:hypothetical protein
MKKSVLFFATILVFVSSFNCVYPSQCFSRLKGRLGFSLAALGAVGLWARWYSRSVKPNCTLAKMNVVTACPIRATQYDEKPKDAHLLGIKGMLDDIQQRKPIARDVLLPNKVTQENILIKMQSGVPVLDQSSGKRTIFIYSAGWETALLGQVTRSDGTNHYNKIKVSQGVGVYSIHHFMRAGILNGVTVGFDYPTDARRSFDGAQEAQIKCLKDVYDEVVKHNPDADIVFAGECIGATTILNLITHPIYKDHLERVKGIILESPPITVKNVAETIAGKYLWWLPGGKPFMHGLFRFALPSYNPTTSYNILNAENNHLLRTLPICIGSIIGDDIASDDDTIAIAKKLRSSGNEHVYLFRTPDRWMKNGKEVKLWHSSLRKLPKYKGVVNAFCARYQFPHNKSLADAAQEALEECLVI